MKTIKNGNRLIQCLAGEEIDDELIRIIYLSNRGHRKEMRQYDYEKIKTTEDLAFAYASEARKLRLLLGDDWYMLFEDDERTIRALDFVKTNPMQKEYLTDQQRELAFAFDYLLECSVVVENGKLKRIKEIATELREDTSYYLFLLKKKHNVVDQIYEETVRSWYTDDGIQFSEEDQKNFLKHAREKRKEVEQNGVLMHTVWFVPSKKTVEKILQRKMQIQEEGEMS